MSTKNNPFFYAESGIDENIFTIRFFSRQKAIKHEATHMVETRSVVSKRHRIWVFFQDQFNLE